MRVFVGVIGIGMVLTLAACERPSDASLERSPVALLEQVRKTGQEPIPLDPLRPTAAEVMAYAAWTDQICGDYSGPRRYSPECKRAVQTGNAMAVQLVPDGGNLR